MSNLVKKWAKDLNRQLTKEDVQVANEHLKIYSTSYVITEMHIKTIQYHYTPIRTAKF